MSLLCAFGRHRARPMARWNGGYYFSTCARCGKDLVRTPFEGWHVVPRGYRVVWSPTPPPRTLRATLSAAAPPVPSQPPVPAREPAPAQPARAFAAPSPSELDSAARESDLSISEVLRLLREDEQRAPAEPDAPLADPLEGPGASRDSDPLELAEALPAMDDDRKAAPSPAADAPGVSPAAFTDGFDDDFMAEGSEREFWSAPSLEPMGDTPAAVPAEDSDPATAEPAAPGPIVESEAPDVAEPEEDEAVQGIAAEATVEPPPGEEPPTEITPAGEPEADAAEPAVDSSDMVAPVEADLDAAEPASPAEAEAEPDSEEPSETIAAPELEAEPEAAAETEAQIPQPETDAIELPASTEMAALAEPEPVLAPAAEPEPVFPPAEPLTEVAPQEPPRAPPAPPEPPAAPVAPPAAPSRDKAAWPSAAPTQDHARIVGMDDAPRASAHMGLAIAGALLLGAGAVFLFTRVPHPEPSGSASMRQAEGRRLAPAIIGQPAYVTVRLLSCHASSVLQSRTVRILARGDQVQVLAREPGWASVMKDGRQCWVVDRYVSSVRPL